MFPQCSQGQKWYEKSTCEIFVSAWFSCSGTQDVSVAATLLLLILFVRSHCTQESLLGNLYVVLVWVPSSHRSLRSLTSITTTSTLKASFRWLSQQCLSPCGVMSFGYINEKNTAFLLCFLVAGPRIELGTSWLWIKNRGICENSRKYKSQIIN